MNAYDDIWFWPLELIHNFQGTVLEQVFNFYQGPLPLESVERLVLSESGENDFHIVVFAENAATDEEARKKLKTFRKFHTMNTDKNFHFKFWICENKEVAQKLNIDTSKSGDVYMLRQAKTVFNPKKGNVEIEGYAYTSEVLLTEEECQESDEQSFAKIFQQSLNGPIIVHNYMQFGNLKMRFNCNILVVYCNPKVHGQETYDAVLKALVEARR